MRRCGMRLVRTSTGLEHRTTQKYHPEMPRPHRCCSPQQTSYGWSVHSCKHYQVTQRIKSAKPINFVPYIWQPALLWDVTQWLKKSVSSWILCSTTN